MTDERGAQAAAYLRMLLVRAGEPRSIWVKHAADAPPGRIDAGAVAEVLRAHGGSDQDTGADATRAVRAALEGTAMTAGTLELFIDAFRLHPRHASRLRSILSGAESVRVLAGETTGDLPRPVGPPRHETLALHELHILGPDGIPAEHQTIQLIRSTVDGLDVFPYRFDTDELVVEVVRGGRVGDLYRVAETLYGVDLVLDRPLARGETALMHYRTAFGYRTAPPPVLRRGTRRTMRDVTLWVQFHPDRLPARVWLARWDSLDHGRITEQQPVELDGEYSVQARYDEIEKVIVGFHWEWD